VLFTGSSIGAMVAPVIATSLESRFGWRVAFLGTAIIGLLWVPLWLRVAWSADVRAAIDGESVGPRPPPASILEVAFHPAVLRATLLVVASVPAIGFVLTWGAKYLVTHQGLTQASMGRYLWMPPLFYDAGSILFGDLASRRARARKGAPDVLLVAVAGTLGATMMVLASTRGPWITMIWASVSMAGCGGIFALLTSDMMMRVPASAVSIAGGVCAAVQSLVLIVANPLIGRVIDRTSSYTPVILVLGAWLVPGCLAWILWKPRPLSPHAPSSR
jgi:MFS transporter, ACS family, hexuronate transporter